MVSADFESRVRRQIERLQTTSYLTIEREMAEKRLAWFRQTRPGGPPTPRRAYELLFFDYMGLPAGELPVVRETENEIAWRSLNPCPTLEACRVLGLDTRQVCRAAYEKSTQALVSQLDPQLRFLRSYAEIRPHAPHCLEMIVRVDFEAMMAVALSEARISRPESGPGCGAVVALGNRIIVQDSGLHAAAGAIQQAAQILDDPNLSGAILFATCEPCPDCVSRAAQANLSAIVYGAPRPEAGSTQEAIVRSGVMVELIGGVLAEECRSLSVNP